MSECAAVLRWLMLPCTPPADDTNAITKAIERASELALQLTTEPCGSHNSRRCPVRGGHGAS